MYSYNLSLINRGDLIFWIDENIARYWYSDTDSNTRGKQYVFSDVAIETALKYKKYIQFSAESCRRFLNFHFQAHELKY